MKHSNQTYANVHSIETLGAFDGPGIRYVIFLQGCPFQCQYCHNRDTWSQNKNKLMSVSDILNEYQKYNHFYKKGGITVSGGEPLLQIDFLIELFKKAKECNIHTALDTSAACYNFKDNFKFVELMKYTDLVLLDIKHIDEEKHIKLTKSTNKQVLEFARFLDMLKIKVIIRHVLIPTITNDIEDLKRFRSFLDTLTNVIDIEILPYHKKGIKKWQDLNFTYELTHILEPTIKEIEEVELYLKSQYKFHKA